ncbi:MAG TPA: universal stress protein [Xanthobacteraceae bacterium]
MIKDILVNLSPGDARDPAADYAISLAGLTQAHLAGIAFRIDPAATPGPFPMFSGKIIEAAVHEHQEAVNQAIERFTHAARVAGVSHECMTHAASLISAADTLGRTGRRFDLMVVGQPVPKTIVTEDLMVQAALFDSGRPLIVVPYIQRAGAKFDRVAVCWDGSRSAARAIADALPLLGRAAAIDLVIVTDEPLKSDDVPGADIAQHLARHDLPMNVCRIGHGEIDVGNTILNFVADHSIDFLVMGGYGHSRLRERVFGGVTQTMLMSMTVPTLMSH